MKILFVGDVVRQAGCDFLRRELPNLRRFYGADMTIVNGENAAEGNGILPGPPYRTYFPPYFTPNPPPLQ